MSKKLAGLGEAVLSTIFKDLPVGVALFDLQGALVKCNTALRRMLGYEGEDELPPIALAQFVCPEKDMTPPSLPEDLTSLDGRVLEKHYTRLNGESLWGRLTISLISNADGKHCYIRGILENITDYKQALESAKQEHYLSALLMDHLPDHIYLKDLEGRFLRVNQALSKAFGLNAPEEVVGKSDHDFFSAQHADEARTDEQKIIQTGETHHQQGGRRNLANRPSQHLGTKYQDAPARYRWQYCRNVWHLPQHHGSRAGGRGPATENGRTGTHAQRGGTLFQRADWITARMLFTLKTGKADSSASIAHTPNCSV